MPVQLPKKLKPTQPVYDENAIIGLAKRWVELHDKPKTRGQMDDILQGLPEPIQRKVILCSQRLSAGLPYKIAPDVNQSEWRLQREEPSL